MKVTASYMQDDTLCRKAQRFLFQVGLMRELQVAPTFEQSPRQW